MRRAPSIELTAAEREVLEKTVRCTTSAVRDVFRARIVLLAAKGSQSRDIAAELDAGQDTVSKWRRRFAPPYSTTSTSSRGHGDWKMPIAIPSSWYCLAGEHYNRKRLTKSSINSPTAHNWT